MANKDDLRYVRTEQAIRSTFMGLVAQKSVNTVTVSEICTHAGISRNAFYLHHAGVTELYGALIDELVEDVRRESLASADRRTVTGKDDDFGMAILSALGRHEQLLRALLPADDGPLAKCLAEGIEDAYVEAALRFGEHGGRMRHRLSCAFSAWAAVGFVLRWVSLTDRPLAEAREVFNLHQSSVSDVGADYLLHGRKGS